MWVRLHWSKVGKIRWTSHRDAARMWERAFRRAELSITYSAGFSPRPRVSFGLALPTGCESLAEFMEVDLADNASDLGTLAARLAPCLPMGMAVVACGLVGPDSPSVQEDVVACEWVIEVHGPSELQAHDAVGQLLAADQAVVMRQRKGTEQPDDIRPGVQDLTVLGRSPDGTGVLLRAVLATKPRGVRPGDLIIATFPSGAQPAGERRSLRLAQFIDRPEGLHPLWADAAHAA
jgi:radical SAM-linked protein